MRTVIKTVWSAGALLVLLGSCNPPSLTKEQLKAYVLDAENGLHQVAASNGIKMEVLYRPLELVAEQNVDLKQKGEFEAELKRLDSLDFFIIKLSRDGQEIENQYAGTDRYMRVTNYLNGEMGNDLQMIVGNQTYSPEGVVFAPSFGGADGSSVLVTFKTKLKNASGPFVLLFNDAMLGMGRMELTFQTKAVRNCPTLAL
jgi:hypothetical protein